MTGTIEPDAAVTATNGHYELPVELFGRFLGRRMKYSCGLYDTPATTLDEAQEAKLRWVLDRNLRMTSGQRLLDIGCGWGSLTLFAAERGCHVVGITPSRPQRDYILRQARERGLGHLIDVRLGRFTSVDLDGEDFNAAAMIGSIVHMPDRDDVLAATRRRLKTGGRLYLSESCFRNQKIFEEYRASPGFRFVGEDIFGFGEMVPLAGLIAAAENAGLSIVRLADLTAHYPCTLADWSERVRDGQAEIDAVQPGASARLLRYFEIGATAFGYTTKHYAFVAEKSRMGRWEE
jgi:cyclopropane-fatty-acyl-phospholipid synthase